MRNYSTASAGVELLRAQARKLSDAGAHDRAEPLLEQVLATMEATHGSHDAAVADALLALADCRLGAGRIPQSLSDYRRLLGLLACTASDGRSAYARAQVRRCEEALRLRGASGGLQTQMNRVLQRARGQRAVGETALQHRVREAARRLMARGKLATGARWMERWLELVLQGRQEVDDESLTDLRDHAIALWNAGHPDRAVPALRGIVLALQQRPATPAEQLATAVRDWGDCLTAAGQRQSGQEVLDFARTVGSPSDAESPALPSVLARLVEVDDVGGPIVERPFDAPKREPWLQDLLASLVQRCCFI